ncbi:MAG: phosphatidate cytidylyltransferase [Phycisphaerales bacterium]|jgi:phosphatidate cytidylyltransferase|nr:phosphatidate cytidylyltransferase [Phycisphaerales bacterium]
MSHDATVLKHTAIIYAVIFGVGITLTLLFRKTNWGRNMLVATLSWFVLLVVFVGASFAGYPAFTLLIALIAGLAVREYYVMNGVDKPAALVAAVLLVAALAATIVADKPELFYFMPVAAGLVFFAIQLFGASPKGANRNAAIQYTGLMYWGWLWLHFALLHRLEHGFGYVVLICSLVALNDNSAYFAGKLLGKNSPKLAPRISPGKTWTGTLGGSIATFGAAFLFWYAVPHLSFAKLAGLALLVAGVIPVGDLIESAMKRDAGVKDSGKLIPGHGGAMDRFDSCTFTVPIVYYYIMFVV